MNAEKFVRAALECSIFFCPRDPGLTHDELHEAGRRVGIGVGDVDAGTGGLVSRWGEKKYEVEAPSFGEFFNPSPKPDYRNPEGFEFVCQELRRARSAGAPQLDRDVLVERGAAAGLPRNDVEVAVTIYALTGFLVEKDGAVGFAAGREQRSLPSEQIRSRGNTPTDHFTLARPELEAAYPVVKDIIARRTDGRPPAAEALDAFPGVLTRLGYEPMRMWWVQTVAELRRLDTGMSPVATCVMSAALVEGALTLVVKHGQSLGAFSSSDFAGDPRTWKIENLVKSAAAGGGISAILDASTRHRADALVKTRQRIHAGRMLSEEYLGGVPDLRPEDAREAKGTADLVVRRILDWLDKNPPATR